MSMATEFRYGVRRDWFPALYESLTGRLVKIDGLEFVQRPTGDRVRCDVRDETLRLTCCLWPRHDGPHVGQPDIDFHHRGSMAVISLRTATGPSVSLTVVP